MNPYPTSDDPTASTPVGGLLGVSAVLGGALLAFLLLPLAALLFGVGPDNWGAALAAPQVRSALGLSAATTTGSTLLLVVAGTPLAWWLATSSSRTSTLVEALVRLPAVTPPAVAGIALLAAYGRAGWLGGWLDMAFRPGAVVMAQLFVAAPFYVLPAAAAFRDLSPELIEAARSLGADPFRVFVRVGLPLTRPALRAAAATAWARALGEFGATLMFAGNLPGRTQTLPLAIYQSMETDLAMARAIAVVLLVLAAIIFFLFGRRWGSRAR